MLGQQLRPPSTTHQREGRDGGKKKKTSLQHRSKIQGPISKIPRSDTIHHHYIRREVIHFPVHARPFLLPPYSQRPLSDPIPKEKKKKKHQIIKGPSQTQRPVFRPTSPYTYTTRTHVHTHIYPQRQTNPNSQILRPPLIQRNSKKPGHRPDL